MSERDKIIKVMARAGASFEEVEYDKFPELFIEQAEHMLAALVKSGLEVVPVEPTEAMVVAGANEIASVLPKTDAREAWAAVLAASKETER